MQPANAGRKYPAEPLTADEVQALMGAITGRGPIAVRNRALVSCLWGSGLRVSEALDLRSRDIVPGGLRVRHGKGDQDRVVGLHPEAAAHLATWLEVRKGMGLNGRQPVFCSIATGRTRKPGDPIDPSYVRRLLPKLAVKAGIDKRVHAHGLRHTHATLLLDKRAPLRVIQDQLGHGSALTTETYLGKIAPAARLDALAVLWAED